MESELKWIKGTCKISPNTSFNIFTFVRHTKGWMANLEDVDKCYQIRKKGINSGLLELF